MPLLLDLFCGRGGWSRAAVARGWSCVGYDVDGRGYPCELVRRRLPVSLGVLRRHRPALVVASPPCEEFARRCLPWQVKRYGDRPAEYAEAVGLLRWCLSLIGSFDCPVVVECSWFADREIGGGRLVGSYALWGDVPALMPEVPRRKTTVSVTKFRPDRAAIRGMIEPVLADWIVSCAECRLRCSA